MRSVARRLVGHSYALSKQYALVRMRRREPPVVMFSMGKTGSTAIARAVEDATGERVFQVFRLEADRLAQAERRYRADRPPAPFRGARHLWESEFLLRRPPSIAEPWTVITTVREPISQAVSAFFHGRGQRGRLHDAPTIERLVDALIAERWIRAPLRWFDREFAPALGIDVFEQPFDADLGHRVIETPRVRVLLLRQENLEGAPAPLGRFLGLTGPVAIPARNVAVTKEYGGRYREFLAAARLPGAVLDEAYGSRYARHFYADSELERFRGHWGDR